MMIQLPIDSSPLQEMSADPGDGTTLGLTIRYNSIGDHWEVDVREQDSGQVVALAVPLVLGLPMFWRDPVSFFLWLEELGGVGLDPLGGNDFGERFALYLGLKSEARAS